LYLLGKKLIKNKFLPGGIVKQYGLNQEGKIDQWIIVFTVRVTAAISAQRFSSAVRIMTIWVSSNVAIYRANLGFV